MNKNEAFSRIVADYLKERKLSRTSVAKILGLDKDKFNNYLSNKAKWNIDFMYAIADYIGKPIDELTGTVKEVTVTFAKKLKPIPILDIAQAGLPAARWQNEGIKTIELEDTTYFIKPFVLIIQGRSMEEYLFNGDKVLCSDEPHKIERKKLIAVTFKSNIDTTETAVKFITWNVKKEFKSLKSSDEIMFYSRNARYEPFTSRISDIDKIYKVVRLVERKIN